MRWFLFCCVAVASLVSCAPASTTAAPYVQPAGLPTYLTYGQRWKVTFPDETWIYNLTVYPEKWGTASFGFTLPTTFSTQNNEVTAQKLSVFYDPVDEDPEFLDFGVTRTQNTSSKSFTHLHCYIQSPSQQADTTRFRGVFGRDIKEPRILDYIKTGNRSDLPECTIERLQ